MADGVDLEVRETEEELVEKAREAVSRCNWVVGECAAKWTRRYARGRTDADFAALVGLSPDQVYQRRRVWETFADVAHLYPSLKWSHFYVALNWDDAAECLAWAEENKATVAEMKAWRRLQHGEDLTAKSSEPEVVTFGPEEVVEVKQPSEPAAESGSPSDAAPSPSSPDARTPAAAYTPYRKDALTPPPAENGQQAASTAVATEPPVATARLVRRMTVTLEKYSRTLTPDFLAEMQQLPEKVRVRFVAAVRELAEKTSGLA